MGEVWKARDTRLDRTVAIKTVNGPFSERFEREARAISALNHPHICTLHDVGEHDGAGYLVMELVEGTPLAGPVPVERALTCASQICSALEAAHKKGITHRDLKPANILVTKAGVKLLDFGLAKQEAGTAGGAGTVGEAGTDAQVTKMLTGAHVVVGTPQYMAPEQIEGHTVDARTDIFALGCVLYELLTGLKAFEGKTPSSVMAAILATEPRPLKELQPLTPASLERTIRRCLAKDPDDRWQSARDLRAELDWISTGGAPAAGDASQPRTAAPTSRGLARFLWPLATAALLAALVTLSLRHFREVPPEPRVVQSQLTVPDDMEYDFNAGPPALSPDGRWLAFAVRTRLVTKLLIRRLEDGAITAVAGSDRASHPFWSPDSRWVAFGAVGELKKTNVTGSSPVPITSLSNQFRGGSWGPSGDIVFGLTGSSRQLFKVSASGGTPVAITPEQWNGNLAGRGHPWFLPDGHHFLYSVTGAGGSCVCLGDLATPDAVETTVVDAASSQGIFADGRIFFLRGDALMAQPFDVDRLRTTGEAQTVQNGVAVAFPRIGIFSVASGGLLTFVTGSVGPDEQRLTWFDRTGRQTGMLGERARFGDLQLSPDGKRLGTTRSSGDTAGTDIWIYDVARGVPTRLTTNTASDQESVWTPDGRTVIWRSAREGQGNLFRRPSDFSGADELLFKDDSSKRPTSISSDGRFLLFSTTPTEAGDLWVLPLLPDDRAGEPRPFLKTPAAEGLGKFSPDGKWVAYQSNDSGAFEIYVTTFPTPGARIRISSNGGVQPRWRQDGREIFYVSLAGELTATEVTPVTMQIGRTQVLLDGVTTNRGYLWDVADNGQRFLVTVEEAHRAPSLTLVQNPLVRKP